MQFLEELTCPRCECDFITASGLLKHFASHVTEEFVMNPDVERGEQKHQSSRKVLPDLHPIGKKVNDKHPEENINPLIFCEVTIDDSETNQFDKFEPTRKTVKYKCSDCKKGSEWSLDVKRCISPRAGGNSFKCKSCMLYDLQHRLRYSRKSSSHKHITNYHRKTKIPDLQPIDIKFSNNLQKRNIS